MTRLNHLPLELSQRLQDKSLLKIISGLSNFDKNSIKQVASASKLGGVDLLDIACKPELVELAIQTSGLPVCVSSVEPDLFPAAVEAGAVVVEIGNFDSFYPVGRFFEAKEVLDLATETRSLLPDTPLSVTVPHILSLDKQAQLALDLVDIGVDIVQTEGGTTANPFSPGSLGLIEKAAPTLAAVHAISEAFLNNNCAIPILCASGLSAVTVPMAISIGASGVGVGSAVNRLSDEVSMLAAIRSLREALPLSDKLISRTNTLRLER
tara:strand:- start:817 stop:1614 length:798 start_codon:yes stop_codon:yes gene_type:complete